MPRVYRKKKNKAGKPYPCDRCGEKIVAGQDYYQWDFRYGGTHRQHAEHGSPKQSQLTQSKMSGVYAAIESAEEVIQAATEPEEIASALISCADEVEQVKDEYQDSLDNMPDGLRDANTEIPEKIDALEEFISELQPVAGDVEGSEFDELDEPKEPEEGTKDYDEAILEYNRLDNEYTEAKDNWLSGLRDTAQDALGSLSC